MKSYIKIVAGAALVFGMAATSFAQQIDPEYVKVTNERAQKIVDNMSITDAGKAVVVRDLIANQYRALNEIHEGRDAEITKIKASGLSKEKTDASIEKVKASADKKVEKLHKSYIKDLSKELTDEQVTQVKDGMTYNVAPNTYYNYLDMLPNLTEAQKKMVLDNLTEAREHAMDAGSSKEKHAWFGKYKGRINNNLSADGYDLKQEGIEWQKRIEERKKNQQ